MDRTETTLIDIAARLLGRLVPWALPVLLLLAWEIGARSGVIPAHLLPAPSAVVLAFRVDLQNGVLVHDTLASLQRASAGFVLGGVFGFALGIVNGACPVAARLTDSTLQLLRHVPHLAFIPLALFWFGGGERAILFLIAIGVFFPVYARTCDGIRRIDRGLLEMGRLHGLSAGALLLRIMLPGALPSILSGLRQGLGMLWLTLIVAEIVSAQSGLGAGAMQARDSAQADVIVLDIAVYALLGKLVDLAFRRLEHRVLAWRPSFESTRAAAVIV